jgi:hypothetical protein
MSDSLKFWIGLSLLTAGFGLVAVRIIVGDNALSPEAILGLGIGATSLIFLSIAIDGVGYGFSQPLHRAVHRRVTLAMLVPVAVLLLGWLALSAAFSAARHFLGNRAVDSIGLFILGAAWGWMVATARYRHSRAAHNGT